VNIWDVSGGAALVRATGGDVRTKAAQGWLPLDRFEVEDREPGGSSLRRWRQPVILGEPEAVEMLCRRHG
jgi:myo-inositol-1(or 4)-monophosphatase